MDKGDKVRVIEIQPDDAHYSGRREYIGKVGIIKVPGRYWVEIKFDNGEKTTFLGNIKLEKINEDEIIYN